MDLRRSVHNMQFWSYSAVHSVADIWCKAQEYAANVHETYRRYARSTDDSSCVW